MNTSSALRHAAAWLVLAGSVTTAATASVVTADAGAFPHQSDLTSAYDGVTLTVELSGHVGFTASVSNQVVPFERGYFTVAFGPGGGDTGWHDVGSNQILRADFDVLTNFVAVDIRNRFVTLAETVGVIEAYDVSGSMIGRAMTSLPTPIDQLEYHALSIERPARDIAYVRVFGTGESNASAQIAALHFGRGTTCAGDFDGNGTVSFSDLSDLLAVWGLCFDCEQDLSQNDVVGFDDLSALLMKWGSCP